MVNNILMGSMPPQYNDGEALYVTLNVTEDCNLACKYCYMTGKNHKNKMSIGVAKKLIEFVLGNRERFNKEAIVWDFIGGEPFLEIDLIEEITDYIKLRMYELEHPGFNKYRLNFSTNGLNYDSAKVQNYIIRNKTHVSIGISIDGNQKKHDLQRIKLNGEGSYQELQPKIKLWLEQTPIKITKSTFAHEDLIYLKDSVISLWNLGLTYVSANLVYEDVWEDGDDIIFEDQLKQLADYVLENELWNEKSVRFFEPEIGMPTHPDDLKVNHCGCGEMIACDHEGNLFPCIRFLGFTLNNVKEWKIGNIYQKINNDKLIAFNRLNGINQSTEECLNCEISGGCAWCTGNNYDSSGSIYVRSTAICKMHKANVRANEYFWSKLEKKLGKALRKNREELLESVRTNKFKKLIKQTNKIAGNQIFIMLNDTHTLSCNLINKENNNYIDIEVLKQAIQFCEDNELEPIILNELQSTNEKDNNVDENVIKLLHKIERLDKVVIQGVNNNIIPKGKNIILVLKIEELQESIDFINCLLKVNNKVEIRLKGMEICHLDQEKSYKKAIQKIVSNYKYYMNNKGTSELSISGISLVNGKVMSSLCEAQDKIYTIAPNGKIYICPDFYMDNEENSIGDIYEGFKIKNAEQLDKNNLECYNNKKIEGCSTCFYLNKKMTNELMIPSSQQERMDDILVKVIKSFNL